LGLFLIFVRQTLSAEATYSNGTPLAKEDAPHVALTDLVNTIVTMGIKCGLARGQKRLRKTPRAPNNSPVKGLLQVSHVLQTSRLT
jgi:hypothetical protein